MKEAILVLATIFLAFVLGFFLANTTPRPVPRFEQEVSYMDVKRKEATTVTTTMPDGSTLVQRNEIEHEEHRSIPFERQTMAHLVGAE